MISNITCNVNIRNTIFNTLNIANIEGFHKVNDHQYGCIIEDDNGIRRYARIGVIVAAIREDCTADDLMASEIADYEAKQEAKAKRAEERKAKAERDKAKREARSRQEGKGEVNQILT